ncbi:unnamed protein product [Adineta ricciae]|uniref:DUF4200 domain-containing protein n=1 Tax=Adineta ricciae TaxID=249248 RepID=A0A813TEG3_ADIRI|nr:unnamed protein product [Adineta ricciae]
MSCQARKLVNYKEFIKLPPIKGVNIEVNTHNDVKLDLKLIEKYFEVEALDETLVRHRHEYQTRREHLQKRQDALHEKEMMFKERILNYEMYIKELAMKRDRSLKRIDDEKMFIQNKLIEIDVLKKEIEQIHDEKQRLQQIIRQYQPHSNLLTQILDRTDRFHSIDEMIEKFEMLHASYEDILMVIKNSNEELNEVRRQLLSTVEVRFDSIILKRSYVQQRIEKIQTEIENYQQLSKEHLAEVGAIKIAIESMFDLVKRYSHRSRQKELDFNRNPLIRLQQIDTFLSDLSYYVDYINNKEKQAMVERSSNNKENRKIQSEYNSDAPDNNSNQWRISCELNQQEIVVSTNDKHDESPYVSYKVRGEDNVVYTVQINRTQTRKSLSSHSTETKQNSVVTSRNTQTNSKLRNHLSNYRVDK